MCLSFRNIFTLFTHLFKKLFFVLRELHSTVLDASGWAAWGQPLESDLSSNPAQARTNCVILDKLPVSLQLSFLICKKWTQQYLPLRAPYGLNEITYAKGCHLTDAQ